MNTLKLEKKTSILSALVEGNSIRSIERMTGVHRDTILRLLTAIGEKCQEIMYFECREVPSKQLQVDEIWTFCKKKERVMKPEERINPELGDQYVFVAIDAETKFVPAFMVGKRDAASTIRFIADVQRRLPQGARVQLTTDGFQSYHSAVNRAFGDNIDYAQLVKSFGAEYPGPGRYAPPRITGQVSTTISGNPVSEFVSTSYIERQNLTMRMQMRRFTRLTNGFSKKLDNLKAALALHFVHYNFMRKHQTLKTTPAIAAGLAFRVWRWEDVLNYAIPQAA